MQNYSANRDFVALAKRRLGKKGYRNVWQVTSNPWKSKLCIILWNRKKSLMSIYYSRVSFSPLGIPTYSVAQQQKGKPHKIMRSVCFHSTCSREDWMTVLKDSLKRDDWKPPSRFLYTRNWTKWFLSSLHHFKTV